MLGALLPVRMQCEGGLEQVQGTLTGPCVDKKQPMERGRRGVGGLSGCQIDTDLARLYKATSPTVPYRSRLASFPGGSAPPGLSLVADDKG